MKLEFSNMKIKEEVVEALKREGITEPTPVQEKAIPIALEGKDIVAQAQTGTGKTFAFVLPILEKINIDQKNVQALILAPTRELALQITTEAKKVASAIDANVIAIYGGQDVERQIRRLKGGMHIVVATPGRLLDHLRRGTIYLNDVRTLVLDEADQMLTMGFLEEVEMIIKRTPAIRQTMMFSATIPKGLRNLTKKHMKNPNEIRIEGDKVTLDKIRQMVIETTDRHKQEALKHLIKEYNPFLAIVFCRTKRRAKTLNWDLIQAGFLSDELHGDMTQSKRERVMKAFREAKLQILVATDVASRGIDVEGVTHIFNYDIPESSDSYIHRIGRTGRAGEEGMAITFVAPGDREDLKTIENAISKKIERRIYQPVGRAESMEDTFERESGKKKFEGRPSRDSDRTSRSSDRGRSKDSNKGKRESGSSSRRSKDTRDNKTSYSKEGKGGKKTTYSKGKNSRNNKR